MLDTYTTLLTDAGRNLQRNIRDSPILYIWFGFMLVFSVAMTAMLTMFMLKNKVNMSIDDVVFSIFFVFLMKSSADFHKYFVQSPNVSYALSSAVSQRRTVGEIALMIFWTNLGLWVFFSSLFSVFLSVAGVSLGYPIEYLKFTAGVVLGCILGVATSLHFFSPHKLRLLPAGAIIGVFLYVRNLEIIVLLIVFSLIYLAWSMRYALDSYLYVNRKDRQKENKKAKMRNERSAIFFKETTVLWRDRLLTSFVFTAVATGGFIGYLAVFGKDLFIPVSLRIQAEQFLPSVYVSLGIYIVIIFTAVFPAINMFLIEEQTMWVMRHLPVSEKTFVTGKVYALILPFVCSIPFLAYYIAFAGTRFLVFSIWFLVFSYLAGVIISLPFGAKYVGKKSDVLVLYCVALLVFGVVSVAAGIDAVVGRFFSAYHVLFYVVSIAFEVVLLLASIEIAAHVMAMKQKYSWITGKPKL